MVEGVKAMREIWGGSPTLSRDNAAGTRIPVHSRIVGACWHAAFTPFSPPDALNPGGAAACAAPTVQRAAHPRAPAAHNLGIHRNRLVRVSGSTPDVTTGKNSGPMEVESLALNPAQTDTPVREAPAALEGDFAAIYEAHSRPVYYLALRMLGDPTAAEDATHDVFLKVFRKLDQFRGDSAVRTWLYRITINHCQNLLQSWHRRNMISNADEAVWETAPSSADSPLRILETKELGECIQKTLDGLPEEYRLLLLLVADQHLSYEQVGELTEQSADAVRGKLHRARKAFAALFKKFA
jgi:RNA polymerase sigma-70 factor (ECF subfamily)